MKLIFVAKNAFAANFTISADAISVRTNGAPNGAYSPTTASPAQSPSSPTTTRSGRQEIRDRRPLLQKLRTRHVAKLALALLLNCRWMWRPVPTGTVDFITSA